MIRFFCLFGGLLAAALTGCSGPTPEEQIEVSASNDPLSEPRSILQRYADGQALGSETVSFPYMVEQVRKTDPQRADVLEKGLEDLQKAAPGARRAKAKELLAKIQPSMTVDAPAEEGDGAEVTAE